MFFVLSKLLTWLILPLTWIVLLPLFSFVPRWRKHRPRLLGISFLLLVLFTNPMLSRLAVQSWETPAVPLKGLSDTCEFAIVLSGMASWHPGLERVEFYKSSDRLWQALELYSAGKVKKVLITGGSGSLSRPDEREAIYLRDYLVRNGFPADKLIIESNSRNTHENAAFTKQLLDSLQVSGKQYLVTSAFHMPRSLGCFKKVGIEVIPFPADRYSGQPRYDIAYYLLPNPWCLESWNSLIHEWVGYVSYKLAGYI